MVTTSRSKVTKRPKRRLKSAYAQKLDNARKKKVSAAPILIDHWDDPKEFAAALSLHIERHGETCYLLWKAIVKPGDDLDPATLVCWRAGRKAPRAVKSLEYLARIEHRYRLPDGYFAAKLPHPARALVRPTRIVTSVSEQRRLAWHLPVDFERLPAAKQQEILSWIDGTIITGATEYRRFQAAAMKVRYAIRFPNMVASDDDDERWADPEAHTGSRLAPAALVDELRSLVRFKTSTLTEPAYQRRGVWGQETAKQKIEHLSLLLGALAASPHGSTKGAGATLQSLTLGLLIFPQIWDWYVQWRERRRGFYTAWEVDMLSLAVALSSQDTGWLKQTPRLAENLRPIDSLITYDDIETVRRDWVGACARVHAHALTRAKEIQRVARVHRDPFEPILPVLEADSPLAEYRKIADEIVARMPDSRRYPKAAAECLRSLLMVRMGLHLGLRQKNLRQLLLRRRGEQATNERQLETLKRGELRWSERDQGWEVFIPAIAFKNSHSSFFSGRPFRLVLPDLCGLYASIDNYISARPILLAGADDPQTFFVKSCKTSSTDAAYDQSTFYEAWRLTTQRYGVYNPYTGRGAIKGLLPHGPHNVRDVLATHILKQTGSFEQASYAIQDTPDIVAKHYGRFLPENKAHLAAQILNRVWQNE